LHSVEILREMVEALDQEVKAIKAENRSTRIPLYDGVLVDKTMGYFHYTFALKDELHLRNGTPLSIRFQGREYDGEIVSNDDGQVVVGIQQNLGDHLKAVVLIIDAAFLLVKLKQRLDDVRRTKRWLNLDSAKRVLNPVSIEVRRKQPSKEVFGGLNSLNAEQHDAVCLAYGSNAAVVWGPPGTGKTTTLSHVVESHYRAGRSVLLVSNTNVAVDTALEKVVERLKDEPSFEAGDILRYGLMVKSDFVEEYGDFIQPDAVVRRLNPALASEELRLNSQLQSLKAAAKSIEADHRKRGVDRAAATNKITIETKAANDDLARVESQLNTEKERLIRNCRVIATTVYQTYLYKGLDRQFDVVVVDEASMLMTPMTFYAAGLAGRTVVIAGDFRQLPPIVTSEGALPEKWLKRDVFEHMGIVNAFDKGEVPPYVAFLTVQYRCQGPSEITHFRTCFLPTFLRVVDNRSG